MRRIQSISISEVGPFGSLELVFPELKKEGCAEVHVLTGENGTGKTTVLELMANALHDRLPRDYGNRVRINAKIAGTDRICVVGFKNGLSGLFNGSMTGIQELIKFLDEGTWNADFRYRVGVFAYSGFRQIVDVRINGIQELLEHPFVNAGNFQSPGDPQQIMQWVANTIAAEAIASVQKDNQTAQDRRSAISRLEAAIGQIIDKPVNFILETTPYNVKILVDGVSLGFNLLPDGFKSIFSWLADLLIRLDRVKWENDTPVFDRNFILFLDEIEVHMHPAWQRKILPVVQKLFPNAQIFISTHSPFVVGSVDGAWIHKLVKPNGDSKLAEGYPMLSEDAKSYRYWLREVFDIDSDYGIGAEKEMEAFYKLRDDVLKGANGVAQQELVRKGRLLAEQSHEMRQIIEMEIRQLNRRLSLDMSL